MPTPSQASPDSAAPLFLGAGEVGRLMASHDWASSPLGDISRWPAALVSAVELMLPSSAQIVLFWGPQYVALYNDAYAPTIGNKHPQALGRPAHENWRELWDDLEPLLRQVRETGETVSAKDRPFHIARHGFDEQVFFDISFSPVRDADRSVGGVFCIVSETSARVFAQRQVSAERERLAQMFEQAPGFMAVINGPQHVFAMANAAYHHLVGRSDIVGKRVVDALPEIVEQGFVDLLTKVYQTGEPFVGRGMRVLFSPQTGAPAEERYLDFIFQPIVANDGATLGIFVQGHDVSERKRAEQALRESEERFRLVAERAPVMLWMHDQNGKCVYLNRAQRVFWKLTREDISAFNWSMTVHPDDLAGWRDAFRRAMAEETAFTTEARYRRADGEYRIVYTEAHPRFGPRGDFLGMIGVNVDVTDARGAEQARREETRFLEVLNRTGAALAAELDLDRIVQLVTDAGVALTGAQFGAFFYNVINDKGESYMLYTLSGAPREAFADFPMPRATAVFQPIFKGMETVLSDDILQDPRYGHTAPHYGLPKGHPPVRSYLGVPVTSRSGEVLGGLFFGHGEPGVFKPEHAALVAGIAGQAATAIDNARLFKSAEHEIGHRREAESQLQQLNEALEARVVDEIAERQRAEAALHHAQKMETVGQLTGGVAHDFNNLLQIVSGNLEILQRNLPKDAARLRRAADNAMTGAKRAATLTQRLLAFARRQPLAPKPINANKLVAGMSELLYRTLGETIEVETVLLPRLWHVEADPNQLENAILNLAINARDAMPDGGRLTIETTNVHFERDGLSQHGKLPAGSYVLICVSDTGVGMDSATVQRVFEPFFTTKDVGKGTGLGLSMVYGFVQQSGGHVLLESEPERGTAVKVYLPRLVGAVAWEDEAVAVAAPSATCGETILVCEDNDGVRAYSVEVLRDLGYRVLEAEDGPSALQVLAQQARPVDLLFTDVVLPGGMTGAVLAEQARAARPDLKVLFTTGYARSAIVHDGRLDPGVELITKPFTYTDLAARVRGVLDAAG